jgi:hypothetical protein
MQLETRVLLIISIISLVVDLYVLYFHYSWQLCAYTLCTSPFSLSFALELTISSYVFLFELVRLRYRS